VAAVAPRAAVVAVSRGGMAQFERVLASAGVDVAHLFSQFGVRTGEGGPFIPAPRGGSADSSLTPEKLAALSRLVKALPVSAPLQGYEVGSPFGERGDPMNGREAFHTGIDLLAPYMTPVYATAPGVVTFAGYRDDYGKIVEIDHGHGIATRYAHLNRFVVSVGQQVAPRQQIGFLGSTGRATGPHVHYEVVVNGEPQDPAKFMGLARLLPAVALR
jgi:murein DD-endopeptidase MepM/ murein hydrolase activator NlpD